jgi:hypothetical protein
MRFPAWRFPAPDCELEPDAVVPLFAPAFIHDSHYGELVERLGGVSRWPEREHPASYVAASVAQQQPPSDRLPQIGNVSDDHMPGRGVNGEKLKAFTSIDQVVAALSNSRGDNFVEREQAFLALPRLLEAESQSVHATRDVTVRDAKPRNVTGALALKETLNGVLAMRAESTLTAVVPPSYKEDVMLDGTSRTAMLLDMLITGMTSITGPAEIREQQREAIHRAVSLLTLLSPMAVFGWLSGALYSHRYSIAQRAAVLRALVLGCEWLADGGRCGPAAEDADHGDFHTTTTQKPSKPTHRARLYPPIPSQTMASATGSQLKPPDLKAFASVGTVRWRSVRLDRTAAQETARGASHANLLAPVALAAVHAILARHDSGHYLLLDDEVHIAAEVVASLHRILLAVRNHRTTCASLGDPLVSVAVLTLAHPHPVVRQRSAVLLGAVFVLWDDDVPVMKAGMALTPSSAWSAAAGLALISVEAALERETSPEVLPHLNRLAAMLQRIS